MNTDSLNQQSTKKSLGALALFLLLTFAASALGNLATFEAVRTWYPTLEKPSFNPPNSIFGPVWSALYTLMAVSAWWVWKQPESTPRKWGLVAYWVQLVLNAAWSFAFFGMRNPTAGLLVILALLSAILVTTVYFWRAHRLSGLLFLPYLAWVSFATVLNFSIWQLNPQEALTVAGDDDGSRRPQG
jgi:tryptophan-rich sensory protein